MSELEIYQKIILEHSKDPKNFKTLNPCTHSSKGNNPLCGDKVEIFTNVKNDLINEISFQGAGCAISMASASILTEVLLDKKVNQAKEILDNFIKMIESNDFDFNSLQNEEQNLLLTFSEMKKFPMRSKCATMCWTTFAAAINYDNYEKVSK
jgi:nitrogen fixation NifU-like protein